MAFQQLAGGYWADKRGRKVLIVGASFARTLIYLVFATAPTWHSILLGRLPIRSGLADNTIPYAIDGYGVHSSGDSHFHKRTAKERSLAKSIEGVSNLTKLHGLNLTLAIAKTIEG